MSGDRIVACIAIVGMLALVVPRLFNGQTPVPSLLRMAGLWLLIILVIAVVVFALI